MSGSDPMPVLEGDAARRWFDGLERREGGGVDAAVRAILDEVRGDGDRALTRLTERYDGVRPRALRVPPDRCRRALEELPAARRSALERAVRNVERFHGAQRREEERVEVEPGVTAWREFRPLSSVGAYVPGGRAPYPSSLVMAAVPARVAGCGRVVACCPPGPEGEPADAVLAAAALLGIDALYAVGGAQAVAALAWGTETVEAVDKIVGPGSRWVNQAKMAVFEDVAVDLPAGPSEVLVWADRSAEPRHVALELLAQAEHGPDSLAIAVLPDRRTASRVNGALAPRLEATSRRDSAAEALAGSALLVADGDEGARWVDRVAPEHLVILRQDPEASLADVRHAGSVFLGPHAPVAAGDYAVGTNHVLPTRGRARAASALSVDDFGTWIQVQRLDRSGLEALGPTIVELAEWEGFEAHAASVRERLESGPGSSGPEGGRSP